MKLHRIIRAAGSILLVAIVVFAVLGAPTARAASIGTVMCMGDSITLGNTTTGGYRGPLYSLLNASSPGFQFVGASTMNPGNLPANQQQHNGYSSYATLDLSNNLDGLDLTRYIQLGGTDRYPNGGYWLTGGNGTGRSAVYPDVVLLHVGTNDIYQSSLGNTQINLANYRTNLTTLVNKIVTMRPNAYVILADIIPYSGHSAEVASVNNDVNFVAAQFRAQGKRVSVVDMNTSFPSGGSDGTHPNDVGYAWMAQRWNGAINAAVPEPGTGILLIIAAFAASVGIYKRFR